MDGLMFEGQNIAAPLIVTLEDFQTLCEGVIYSASTEPHVSQIDPFCEMKACFWCHRLIGRENLQRGICPKCALAIHGSMALAKHLCTTCKGEH